MSVLRHAACKPLRSRPSRRLYSVSVTPRPLQDTVSDFCTNYAYPFHEFFQQVHEYTNLPWALSIPLGVVLTRTLLIPFRLKRVRQDKDRRLAYPELLLQSRILDRKGDLKLATGVSNRREFEQWKQKEFAICKRKLEMQYKHMIPASYETSDTRHGLASLISGPLLLCNSSTLAYLSVYQPDLIHLSSFTDNALLFYGSLYALVLTNAAYYRSRIPLPPKTGYLHSQSTEQVGLFSWSRAEADIIVRYLIPAFGIYILSYFPDAVVLCVLSNSAYTFLERHALNFAVQMPEGIRDSGVRQADQSTSRKGSHR